MQQAPRSDSMMMGERLAATQEAARTFVARFGPDQVHPFGPTSGRALR